MYPYLGDFALGSTVYLPFHTFDTNGASVIISNFLVADVAVYKNGGITQRASTAGYTLLDTDGINFDGVTGIHGISIDTSNNTDAGFYVAGEYMVVIGPITVDGQTVNFIAGTFSLERINGVLALLKGASGLAAIKNETSSIQADTDNIQTRLPAALVSGRMDSSAGALAAGVITSASITDASLTAAKFASDFLTAAKIAPDVTTELQAGLATSASVATLQTSINTVDDFLDTEIAAIKAVTDKLDTAMQLDGAVYRFTLNALELAPGGSGSNPLILATGTALAGGPSTIRVAAAATSVDNQWALNGILLTGGTGVGQSRQILSGTTSDETMTVNRPWAIVPDNTTTYAVFALGQDAATLDEVAGAVWGALRVNYSVSGSFGEYVFSDMLRISNDATAADNAEKFFDGTGYALAGVTLPWNPSWDAEVQSEVNDALIAYGVSAGGDLSGIEAKIDTIDNLLDTEITDIRNRLPAALNNGFMSVSLDAGLGIPWQLNGVGAKNIGPPT